MLSESDVVTEQTQWKKVKGLFERDVRYKVVEGSVQREEWFNEHVKLLASKVRVRRRVHGEEEDFGINRVHSHTHTHTHMHHRQHIHVCTSQPLCVPYTLTHKGGEGERERGEGEGGEEGGGRGREEKGRGGGGQCEETLPEEAKVVEHSKEQTKRNTTDSDEQGLNCSTGDREGGEQEAAEGEVTREGGGGGGTGHGGDAGTKTKSTVQLSNKLIFALD